MSWESIILLLFYQLYTIKPNTIYYFNYFAVPEPSSAGALHTNPGPEQCCLAGQSNAKQMLAS